MERKSIGADGYSVETLVRHFEVLSSISDSERDLAARSLDQAANLLRVPESFEDGLVMLEELCGRGVLTSSTFRPVCEQFEAPMPDDPGFNFKDFEIRLKVWLHRHNVPFETWGTGEAKDLDDLARELLS